VAWITAHEFFADLRVEALPEAGQVGSGLHGTMIRREEMNDKGRLIRPDGGSLRHAEEVLEA
jgi:hypothetical protein